MLCQRRIYTAVVEKFLCNNGNHAYDAEIRVAVTSGIKTTLYACRRVKRGVRVETAREKMNAQKKTTFCRMPDTKTYGNNNGARRRTTATLKRRRPVCKNALEMRAQKNTQRAKCARQRQRSTNATRARGRTMEGVSNVKIQKRASGAWRCFRGTAARSRNGNMSFVVKGARLRRLSAAM